MEDKRDLTGGDHSWNNWFRIMWGNGYITRFLIFFTATILAIFAPGFFGVMPDENWNIYLAGFTGLITIIIIYKGFYQKWNDLKNGRSR